MSKIADTLVRLKNRVASEPALDLAVLVAVVHVVTGADHATIQEVAEVVLNERMWELAAVILGGVGVRQSVFSKRSHEDEVVNAASHAPGGDLPEGL